MAESADALDSGSSRSNPVEVQVLLPQSSRQSLSAYLEKSVQVEEMTQLNMGVAAPEELLMNNQMYKSTGISNLLLMVYHSF